MKAVIISFALLATLASAATYHVSTTGSDAADGSEHAPWATIDHAADNAGPGDTVIVAGGTYREKVTPGADGTPGNPVVLWTDPADRAVINGADVITGWTQCTPDDCPGNPAYASIYYADVSVYPLAVYQDGEPLAMAGVPDDGWFRVESAADNYHITDTKNLAGSDGQWTGAYVQYWTSNGHIIDPDIIGYDSLTHTLALDPYWIDKKGDPMAAGNMYRIMNYLPSLQREGRYCVDTVSTPGTVRVYVRPASGGSPDDYTMEVPVRDAGIELRFVEDYVFHGFEITFTAGHGISGEKAEKRVTVENMLIHHTTGAAVNVTENNGTSSNYLFRDCVMHDCADGILCTNVDSVITERCHIFRNRRDGMKYTGSKDMVLRDSYIHHHVWRGHPDGIQFTDVTGFRVENTAIVLAGQTMMSSGCNDGSITNCLGIGAGARAWIGSDGGTGWTFRNNTAGLSEYAPYTATAAPCTLENNIVYSSCAGSIIGTPTSTSCNLGFLLDDDLTGPGDLNADPVFINAPGRMFTTAWDLLPEQRRDTLFLELDASDFIDVEIGDHIEVGMDGVVRTVTARVTDPGFGIVIDPPLDAHPQINLYIFNWEEKTDFTADFRLAAGSPALGAGAGGADIGCDLNLPALNAADFDSDGLVDITGLPAGMSGVAEPEKNIGIDGMNQGLSVFPNPVRSTAMISAAGPVEIFNTVGTMVFHSSAVGVQHGEPVRWNAMDVLGRPVESGTYYVRCGNAVKRTTVIR